MNHVPVLPSPRASLFVPCPAGARTSFERKISTSLEASLCGDRGFIDTPNQ